MSDVRINPRALRIATARALAAGPLGRDLDDHSPTEQRSILAQAEALIRAYETAKADDATSRRATNTSRRRPASTVRALL